MKAQKISLIVLGLSLGFLLINSCKKHHDPQFGNISISLTDAPGNYQQVNVDIKTVSIHLVPDSGSGSGSKWIDLPTKSGVYDLLKLQNGIDTSIVDSVKLAAGKVTQMRLLLGSNNSVMEDSILHSLKVPSGTQSGIKIHGNIVVSPNQTMHVLLDFDANESIVRQGNGNYHLKPVIKTL